MANLAELWAVCVQAGGAVCELKLGEMLTLNRMQFLKGDEDAPAYVLLDLAGTLPAAREKAREWKRCRREARQENEGMSNEPSEV